MKKHLIGRLILLPVSIITASLIALIYTINPSWIDKIHNILKENH